MSKNSSVKYYQVNGERLQKKLMKNIFWKRSLSKEEIENKQEYDRKRYKNLSEDEKNKLFKYRKKVLLN